MTATISPTAVPTLADRLTAFVTSRTFLWALLAFGIAVRLRQYLFAHSYWYDEAFLLLTIRERGFAELLGPQPYHLVSPPAFLWIIRSLHQLLGGSELVMRLPAFVAGIAALFLMVPLARRVVGNVHAVWAVGFLAVARNAVWHSCEVHPYAIDLLFTIVIVWCTAILVDGGAAETGRRSAAMTLGAAAAVGPWLSFSSPFVLAGASAALLVALLQRSKHLDWFRWIGFNAITAFSGALLWWCSARHMYYDGMIEHWGHRGWGGFPDWGSPFAIVRWALWRPGELGNYGNRELGIVLTALAIVGARDLARRSRPLLALLVVPFTLTLISALIGKYPLAGRTGFFLLPTLWLLAACGISALVDWARQRGRQIAYAGVFLLAWDAIRLSAVLVRPNPQTDYRGAYAFVTHRRAPGDLLWAQTAVVYQTYYGKDAPVLMDHEIDEALELAKSRRLWVVVADHPPKVRARFEAAGAAITLRQPFSGLEVLLLEPPNPVR